MLQIRSGRNKIKPQSHDVLLHSPFEPYPEGRLHNTHCPPNAIPKIARAASPISPSASDGQRHTAAAREASVGRRKWGAAASAQAPLKPAATRASSKRRHLHPAVSRPYSRQKKRAAAIRLLALDAKTSGRQTCMRATANSLLPPAEQDIQTLAESSDLAAAPAKTPAQPRSRPFPPSPAGSRTHHADYEATLGSHAPESRRLPH